MTGLLLGLLLKATVVLALSYFVTRALHQSSASTRHWVWKLCFLALLLLPASLLLPEIVLPVLKPVAAPAAGSEAPKPSDAGSPSPAATPIEPSSRTSAVFEGEGRHEEAPLQRQEELPPGLAVGLGLYLLGGLAAFGYFAFGIFQARHLTRRAADVTNLEPWAGLLPTPFRGNPALRVCISDEIRVPMTWGFRRPAVILPREIETWPEAERHQALTHELAHVERRDWLFQGIGQLACTIYWFHPLAWMAARSLSLEAERAADDRVLLQGADATDYAGQLLSFVRRLRAQPVPIVSVLPMARRSQLPARVSSLLDPQLRRSPMNLSRKIFFSTLAVGGALGLGVVQLAPADAPPTPLLEAAARGDLSQVRGLLEAGSSVDQAIPHRGTPLIVAAAQGNLELVDFLLASGADPNLAETKGPRRPSLARTPLTAAAWSGNVEVVRSLLNAGAKIDRAPSGDATALIQAARSGHGDIVRLLVESGADVNRSVRGDGSPLIAAAARGDVETVNYLIAAGADASDAVRGDASPLLQAAGSGNVELLRALISAGADVNQEVRGDGSPLIVAAARGNVEILEELIDRGADIDREVRGDGNALIKASAYGHQDAVRYLVEAGAEIDKVVDGDENALIQAAGAGHLEIVRYLVAQGADVNARVLADRRQVRTPLNRAEAGGHGEVAAFLRSAGAKE